MKFVTADKIYNIFDQLISIRLKENLKILESILKALKSETLFALVYKMLKMSSGLKLLNWKG